MTTDGRATTKTTALSAKATRHGSMSADEGDPRSRRPTARRTIRTRDTGSVHRPATRRASRFRAAMQWRRSSEAFESTSEMGGFWRSCCSSFVMKRVQGNTGRSVPGGTVRFKRSLVSTFDRNRDAMPLSPLAHHDSLPSLAQPTIFITCSRTSPPREPESARRAFAEDDHVRSISRAGSAHVAHTISRCGDSP